jgi:hypothetical protein
MQSNIDFVDKSFSVNEKKNYRLSIQVSLSGFSFCLYDFDKQKHVLLKKYSYSRNIADINLWVTEIKNITENMMEKISPIATKCLFLTQKTVLIPKTVFSETNIRSHLSLSFHLDELDEIQYRYVPEIEGYCCFAIPSPVISEIISRFGNVDIFNQTYQVIRRPEITENRMTIVFCGNFLDISIFKNNKLVMNNSFEIFDIKDVIYFISAILKKFDIQNIPIYISGEILSRELISLNTCFPNIIPNRDKKISLLLGSEISSNYYNLLTLHKCE